MTLLVGLQDGHPACKNMGGWWRWALVSPDGVAPSRMVGVSASVNLPLHYSLLVPAHPGGPRKKGRKTVVVGGGGNVWQWVFTGRLSNQDVDRNLGKGKAVF